MCAHDVSRISRRRPAAGLECWRSIGARSGEALGDELASLEDAPTIRHSE